MKSVGCRQQTAHDSVEGGDEAQNVIELLSEENKRPNNRNSTTAQRPPIKIDQNNNP